MNKRVTEHAARMRLRTINERLSGLERAARTTTGPAKAIAIQNLKDFWTQVATDRTLIKDARIFRRPKSYQRDKQRENQRRRREQLRRDRAHQTSTAELPTLYGIDLLG